MYIYIFQLIYINYISFQPADDVVWYDVLLLLGEPLHGESVNVQQVP